MRPLQNSTVGPVSAPPTRLAYRLLGLLAVVLLGSTAAACGDAEPDPDGDPATTAPAAAPTSTGGAAATPSVAPPQVELIEIAVVDGRVEPSLQRVSVDRGERVRIVVTSDVSDELHLHGYDLTAELGPDAEGVIEFVADQPGLFELETHHSGLVLLQLQVQ